MYSPVQNQRFFAVETFYSDVDWSDFRQVLDAFQRQLEYWYILPTLELKSQGHFAFSVAASACLLADALSQYEEGEFLSSRTVFQDFLRKHFPDLAKKFPTPIKTAKDPIVDAAGAIYFGLRCGVLHEAHPSLYVGLFGQATISEYHASGFATYLDGTPCPVVGIDPGRLFDGIHARLKEYLMELANPDAGYDQLRANFKTKFENSYGVAISIAV